MEPPNEILLLGLQIQIKHDTHLIKLVAPRSFSHFSIAKRPAEKFNSLALYFIKSPPNPNPLDAISIWNVQLTASTHPAKTYFPISVRRQTETRHKAMEKYWKLYFFKSVYIWTANRSANCIKVASEMEKKSKRETERSKIDRQRKT